MVYDVIILGGGCAGLTAGIYAGRAQLQTLILETGTLGGQAAITDHIGNYPGVPDTSGTALMETMLRQARSFGVEYKTCQIRSVVLDAQVKRIETDAGTLEAYAVILATGAVPKHLGFAGEEEFRGRGVGYCATCDGFFFQDKDIFVIGGGNSAAEEALYLTRFGKRIIMLVRKDTLRCEKAIAQKLLEHPKIEVRFHTELVRAYGDRNLTGAQLRDNRTGEVTTYTVDPADGMFGIFVFVGYEPASQLFRGQVELNEAGYVQTDTHLHTNLPGVFAAGDVRSKELRQLVTATADGAIAATEAGKYVLELQERLGIQRQAPTHQADTGSGSSSDVLPEALREQLRTVFGKLQRDVVLVMAGDPAEPKTKELEALLRALCGESNHLSLQIFDAHDSRCPEHFRYFPAVALLDDKGNPSGIRFSGVPMGHELNSLIFAIYNLAGPGQTLPEGVSPRIAAIKSPVKLEIAVSLSCHFCPEVVIAAQRIAAESAFVEAEMIDVGLFSQVREQYNLMSVPAVILNGKDILFGSKTIEQLLDAIERVQ